MRNLEKSQELQKQAGPALEKTLEIKQLDVTSEDSIQQCVDSIPQRRIDVLGRKAKKNTPQSQKILFCSWIGSICFATIYSFISHLGLAWWAPLALAFALDQTWIQLAKHICGKPWFKALGVYIGNLAQVCKM